MPKRIHASFKFLDLYQKFLKAIKTGRRLQPNGKRLAIGTLNNYEFTGLLLRRFCTDKSFELVIRSVHRLNQRELKSEARYWKRFYKGFTDFLYEDLGYYDNTVGHAIKNIRSFFGYLNKELGMGVGEFYKTMYVRKEEIPIFPLMPEELNYLIYDKDFENTLKPRMREVKDFFVFGCTVALRFSDLVRLQKSNIRFVNGNYYLAVRSVKTSTDTLIKLPGYAMEIVDRYARIKKSLLPKFNIVNSNKFIKRLLEMAGFTQNVAVSRSRRGIHMPIRKQLPRLRFCDIATTHTMRRTAITTMLSLGVSEQIVRKISGHSASSKEFYRYVVWAQPYQDKEMERMFTALNEKKLIMG